MMFGTTKRRPTKATTKHQKDAQRKRQTRKAAVDIASRKPGDPARRAASEADLFLFLRTYFSATFYHEFTPHHREIGHALLHAAEFGGDQAIAAPRGDGKTTIAECVAIFCVLTGRLKFPLIAGATGPDAQRILTNIRTHLERQDPDDPLRADFPELDCIAALEGKPQRAGGQTVDGKLTGIRWASDQLIFPTYPEYPAYGSAGAVLMTRGLDCAIRGIRVHSLRPDLVIIDDPETRESADSEPLTRKREKIIETDLAGLGGPGKALARVMLTTLMKRDCLSATYTDPKQKPSWQGKRFRLIDKWPERMDQWDVYQSLRQANQQAGDEHARGAHKFYLDHRAEMDAGAVVTSPQRFVDKLLPDGSQIEASALQAAFNIIADRDLVSFQTEYQNDPPEEAGLQESGITANRIQRQVSGYSRKIIPPECVKVTQGIDVRKTALHYTVRAWLPDGTGYTIDYGVQEVRGTRVGSDEGVDEAITRALTERREAVAESPYTFEDGQVKPIDLTLVDAGWRTEIIYSWTYRAGLHFKPSMGFGKSAGCVSANFHESARSTVDKKMGDHWFLSRKPRGVWLVCMDTDHWKAWEHDRWTRDPEKPGALLLFGHGPEEEFHRKAPDAMSPDQKDHFSYSKHICAEIEVEEVVRGALKRYWKSKRDTNHYFDASYMATVAASMEQVGVLGERKPVATTTLNEWLAGRPANNGRR